MHKKNTRQKRVNPLYGRIFCVLFTKKNIFVCLIKIQSLSGKSLDLAVLLFGNLPKRKTTVDLCQWWLDEPFENRLLYL